MRWQASFYLTLSIGPGSVPGAISKLKEHSDKPVYLITMIKTGQRSITLVIVTYTTLGLNHSATTHSTCFDSNYLLYKSIEYEYL